ncbi:membrane protein [Paenibacillus glycanilyticus]|uniref:Membrane protein n=2 Tax=Paenibacillus glycanilyticus TaxID=126569 RepID=A0ABQ6GI15_9BACL|nr:membrane protein [Paenibacillus glycanilyticus]
MKKHTDRLLVIWFVLTIAVLALLFLLSPARKFSELENRYLQVAPKLTWDNLIAKKFAEEAETYVTDHFPLRGNWVGVKSAAEQLRLQQENNGIYKGKDGYLFEKFTKPDSETLGKYTDAIKEYAAANPGAKLTFLLAPTSIGLYPDKLPWKAPFERQDQVNEEVGERLQGTANLTYLNGFGILSPHGSEPIYYRTDHHWTTLGAYYAYEAYAKQMGWTPHPLKDYAVKTVSDSFLGSYHTRGQFSLVKPDRMQIFVPKEPVATSVYVADTDTTSSSLYDESYLAKKDKYSYFLGGVHALMTLTSDIPAGEEDLDKLLVIKDSYAHNILPFLAQHVKEIHVIDMRYYNGSISEYRKANGIHHTLMLFNTATFSENNEILKLGK